MIFLPHWKRILTKAASSWFLYIALFTFFLDGAIDYLSPWIPLDTVLWVALVVAIIRPMLICAALFARIIAQKSFEDIYGNLEKVKANLIKWKSTIPQHTISINSSDQRA